MKRLGFRNSFIAVALIAALVLAGTGCDKKISSSDNTDPKTVKRFGGVPPYADTRNFVNQILSGLNK